MGPIFIMELNVGAEPAGTAFASDSSSKGFALYETSAAAQEVEELIRFRERWRFLWEEPEPAEAAEIAGWAAGWELRGTAFMRWAQEQAG